LDEAPSIRVKLSRGYLQVIQNFHLEGREGESNTNPGKQTMIHHDIRFLVLGGRTTHTLIFICQDHLIRVLGVHILLLRSPTISADLKGVEVETNTPVVFDDLKVLIVLYIRGNIQHPFINPKTTLDAFNVGPLLKNGVRGDFGAPYD
jgi:hypothetical protein